MDSDPPPSYNSVVGGGEQLRRRPKTTTSDTNDTNLANVDGRTDDTNSDRDTHHQTDNNLSTTYKHSIQAVKTDEGAQEKDEPHLDEFGPSQSRELPQQTQRLSAWGRFRKGLEDVVMFIIQILD